MPSVVSSQAPLVRFWSERGLLDPVPPADALIDRLGNWLDVRQAIALHQQLGPEREVHLAPHQPPWVEQRCERTQRVLSQLRDAIRLDRTAPGLWRNPMPAFAKQQPTDWNELWEPYRRYMNDHQKQMALVLARERRGWRDEMIRRPGPWATLAQIDAAFEHAIAPHESKWLSSFPVKMEHHLSQLLAAEAAPGQPYVAIMHTFQHDVRVALLHELDLRSQPLLGLLETLQTAPT